MVVKKPPKSKPKPKKSNQRVEKWRAEQRKQQRVPKQYWVTSEEHAALEERLAEMRGN